MSHHRLTALLASLCLLSAALTGDAPRTAAAVCPDCQTISNAVASVQVLPGWTVTYTNRAWIELRNTTTSAEMDVGVSKLLYAAATAQEALEDQFEDDADDYLEVHWCDSGAPSRRSWAA